MAYSDLTSNRTVSFNNLSNAVTNGIFQQLTSIPSSNEQITKSDASTYVSIDTSYSPYSNKSSNQLVIKSNLNPVFQNTNTLYYSSGTDPMIGWSSLSNACSNYSGGATRTAYWNGTLSVGTTVFTNANTIDGTNKFFVLYDGTNYNNIELTTFIDRITGWPGGDIWGYYVNSISTCIISYAFDFDSTSYGDPNDACSFYTPTTTMYAAANQSLNVTQFFTDANLTTAYAGNNNYFAWDDNTTTARGTIDGSGFVNNIASC